MYCQQIELNSGHGTHYQAEREQTKAETCKREMLEAYQQSELSMKIILEILRDSRDILTGANSKQMKVLGQWGFDVRDARNVSAQAEVKKV